MASPAVEVWKVTPQHADGPGATPEPTVQTTTTLVPESIPYQVMPTLDAGTRAALRRSIEMYGVLVPIVVTHTGDVVDGHHRLAIATELEESFGLTVLVPQGISPSQEAVDSFPLADPNQTAFVYMPEGADPKEIARTLNLDRRHLSPEQRQELVGALRSDGHSIRAISAAVGISKSQVDRDLKEVSRAGHLSVPDAVTGTDAKSYPATKAPMPSPGPQRTEPRGVTVGWYPEDDIWRINADRSARNWAERVSLIISVSQEVDWVNVDGDTRIELCRELGEAQAVIADLITQLRHQ